MANYVKVKVRRHEDPYWAWGWECLMCTDGDQHPHHEIALRVATAHASNCPGARAATERDCARRELQQVEDLLSNVRGAVQLFLNEAHAELDRVRAERDQALATLARFRMPVQQ